MATKNADGDPVWMRFKAVQVAKRKRWREEFGGLSPDERLALIPADAAPSEFEVQAFLYHALVALGWKVRGELKTRCRACRFDLVVFDAGNRAVRIIEVKKRRAKRKEVRKEDSRQASRYTEFGIPVDLVRGMADAQRYIDAAKDGPLPHPTHTPSRTVTTGPLPAPKPEPPAGQRIVLTAQMIEAGRGPSGGFKARQLRLIGVAWPIVAGWPKRAVGTEVSERDYRRFLAYATSPGKGKHV